MEKQIRILVACDSFKGSLTSARVGEIFAEGARAFGSVFCVKGLAVGDGGEGTLDAIAASEKYDIKKVICKNPLFEDIQASYAADKTEERAFVEMAQASGLTLIRYKAGNAEITSSYGAGQLIAAAMQNGAKEIFISAGGSATNDGGTGALAALGYRFFDRDGGELVPIGKNLELIERIDCSNADIAKDVRFTVMADVDNPLLGERGATRVYGGQKGATPEGLERLERGMRHYADVVERTVGVRLYDMPFAGAAGGLAGGLIAFLGAKVMRGIDTVLELVDFDNAAENSDVIITGEGRLDEQSLSGKTVCGVCKRAALQKKPVYAIAGCNSLEEEVAAGVGIVGVETLLENAVSVEDSIANAEAYAAKAAEKLLKKILSAHGRFIDVR